MTAHPVGTRASSASLTFDHPVRGLNEYIVTTQFRVRRGIDRAHDEDDTRVIKPDLVLFVNGIPLVVMEAKAPSALDHEREYVPV